MCTDFQQYEITIPPAERQLKRYRRKLRRNKRRADGTRRKSKRRNYNRPRGKCYQQYMRLKTVEQSGDMASITMEVL